METDRAVAPALFGAPAAQAFDFESVNVIAPSMMTAASPQQGASYQVVKPIHYYYYGLLATNPSFRDHA